MDIFDYLSELDSVVERIRSCHFRSTGEFIEGLAFHKLKLEFQRTIKQLIYVEIGWRVQLFL